MNCSQVCMYNTLRGCTVDEYGGKCPLFNTGDKEHKPMTNADRIRAMSDEELAKEMRSHAFTLAACSERAWLDWLQQPCGGADHVE